MSGGVVVIRGGEAQHHFFHVRRHGHGGHECVSGFHRQCRRGAAAHAADGTTRAFGCALYRRAHAVIALAVPFAVLPARL